MNIPKAQNINRRGGDLPLSMSWLKLVSKIYQESQAARKITPFQLTKEPVNEMRLVVLIVQGFINCLILSHSCVE